VVVTSYAQTEIVDDNDWFAKGRKSSADSEVVSAAGQRETDQTGNARTMSSFSNGPLHQSHMQFHAWTLSRTAYKLTHHFVHTKTGGNSLLGTLPHDRLLNDLPHHLTRNV
jgi:hypothetical protein